MNELFFDNKYSEVFDNEETQKRSIQDLQLFNSTYRALITKIYILDDKRNYFGLYINENDEIVQDIFTKQRQDSIYHKEKLVFINGIYKYYFPFFENNVVSGNIVVEIDF